MCYRQNKNRLYIVTYQGMIDPLLEKNYEKPYEQIQCLNLHEC